MGITHENVGHRLPTRSVSLVGRISFVSWDIKFSKGAAAGILAGHCVVPCRGNRRIGHFCCTFPVPNDGGNPPDAVAFIHEGLVEVAAWLMPTPSTIRSGSTCHDAHDTSAVIVRPDFKN